MLSEKDILKYLEGHPTESERLMIKDWLGASKENESYFNEIKKLREASSSISNYQKVDIDQEWKSFQSMLNEPTDKDAEMLALEKKKRNSSNFIKYAVAASLAILIGVYLSTTQFTSNEEPLLTETLKVKSKTINPYVNESEVARTPATEAAQYLVLSTQDERKSISLPDNSIAELHENSKLQYPSSFQEKQNREVMLLSGSANFDIVSDPSKEFKVICQGVGIKVLGTEFVVTSTPNNEVDIDLIDGSLQAYQIGREDNAILMKPGDKVSFIGQAFVNITNPPVATPEFTPPTPPEKENLSTYELEHALKFLEKQHGDRFKLRKRLKYDKAQPIKMDIHEEDLEKVISDLERLTQLKAIKGDCDGCHIITSKED